MAIIIDGKKISTLIKEEIKNQVEKIISKGGRAPHLAAVLVGEDGASLTYVSNKVASCKQVGFKSSLINLPYEIKEEKLLREITRLNNEKEVDGFIVQLPLPKHIDEDKVLLAINPKKDVDGFHPTNFGKMALNMETFVSATPYGIIELLKRYDIDTNGKHTVVIGRSNIVGRPISILMSRKAKLGNSTVTVVHSRTKNLKFFTNNADIIISALGVPNFLKANMVKNGVVIIDVGITRVKDLNKRKGYVLKGDADFESVKEKASYITPVPGGVGPMTIASLLQNTLKAYKINFEGSK
ncbi:MAG TPA: bifunctional 5,10-methylene-tetrahydrofolate dehydrogenase/5,10-methylene-tetrahydrofolate cyclohydrolase [Cytophagales bacterium]|jgi:methylenetetrahydrofolate dehydrogenase (NADP+)/methenyltetrahydrofolate cyclohydrolase|nr:bifunctional 5,10-methylene-tetrahydrofolate dehydrogenase/5,10-methylene-tetrahydrofolate cyclohydrolase [Cytophagales bacterium]